MNQKDKHFPVSLSVCFWCGKDKNELIIGRRLTTKEFPKEVVVNYEPCDKCKEDMSTGVTFIEAVSKPISEGQKELQNGAYPTGRWMVVEREAVERMLEGSPLLRSVLAYNRCFVERKDFEIMFADQIAEGDKANDV